MAGNNAWPHIPLIEWKDLPGGLDFLTTTNFSTLIFLVFILVLSICANRALKSEKKSRLKTGFLTFIKFADEQIRGSFGGDKAFARKYFPLIVGLFLIIFLGNLWGLVIDWLGSSISGWFFDYLRPIHSDLNTTVWMALLVVGTFLFLGAKTHGTFHYMKGYIFNFTWETFMEKCINVFVWWLHLIGIPSTIASLSLRLFGNIFAWVVLIWVISYLWALMSANLFEVGRFLTIPFWFFELFVAAVQALVFAWLTLAYIANAREEH